MNRVQVFFKRKDWLCRGSVGVIRGSRLVRTKFKVLSNAESINIVHVNLKFSIEFRQNLISSHSTIVITVHQPSPLYYKKDAIS